jgi:hypothetical protein
VVFHPLPGGHWGGALPRRRRSRPWLAWRSVLIDDRSAEPVRYARRQRKSGPRAAWVTSPEEPAPGRLARREPTPGRHRHLGAGPLLLSSHDRSSPLVSAQRAAPGPSVRQAAWGQAAARWGQTRLPAPDAVTTTVGAAVWAGNVAGACVLCGGGAAGGWTRPAPGPPLPAARAARRSQSCAIGRPKGSICTCTAGPVRTSPPPWPRRHAGRECEPAGPSARPTTDGVGARGRQTRDSGSAGSPGSRAGSSDDPHDPSPHREPVRGLHLLRPAPLPRLVRARPAAQRRLASHPHMVRARLLRRRRAEQRDRKDHKHGRARGRSRGCRLSARFPHGLARCPWRIRRASRWMVRGAGPLHAAASVGHRRHRRRREEYLSSGGGACAPGRRAIVQFRKCEPSAHLVMRDRQERYPGWDWVSGVVVGCLPAWACPGVLVRKWPDCCGRWPGCRYSAL